jgi:hypothetical protein
MGAALVRAVQARNARSCVATRWIGDAWSRDIYIHLDNGA